MGSAYSPGYRTNYVSSSGYYTTPGYTNSYYGSSSNNSYYGNSYGYGPSYSVVNGYCSNGLEYNTGRTRYYNGHRNYNKIGYYRNDRYLRYGTYKGQRKYRRNQFGYQNNQTEYHNGQMGYQNSQAGYHNGRILFVGGQF
ncbi:hypothetical protein [Legionella steigerwaltii]|uniref:hypothetical protein n=1 Tax=Legionella steigerwaltii TaxID=460 RepID=UPI0010544DDC|nr:hypothetical protein [Legionella steigerwaltii]